MSNGNVTKTNEYIDTMPNFFVVKNDTVEYMFDSTLFKIYVIDSGLRNVSVIQMIESGLNHWLDYWYHEDADMYDKICVELYRIYVNIMNFIDKIRTKNESIYEHRNEMIDKFCYPTPLIAESIIHYVIDLTVCDIDKEDATTDVTITNDMSTAIAIMAYYFKILELFSGMNPNINLKEDPVTIINTCKVSEKLVSLCIRDIVNFKSDNVNIMAKIREIFELSDGERIDEKALKNSIYYFITERAGVLWDKSATVSFDKKYLEVGYDSNWNERLSIASAFGACKKFSPPLESDDLISKYTRAPLFLDTNKPVKASLVFYKMGCDYRDFKFIAKQAASYIQRILKQTNEKTATKKTVPNINVTTILNADSESIRRQEAALIEDSKANLYDMRIETCQTQFRDIAHDLALVSKKYDIKDVIKLSEEFDISKSHKLNGYVLSKIFLSLSGERDIYKDVFGVYSKLFLCLFYIRIITNPKYEDYKNIAECMRMSPSVILGDINKEYVDEFIDAHNLNKELSTPFQNICRGYFNKDVNTNISLDEFYNFFIFMKNPYNVRYVMHPNIYSDIMPTKVTKETKYQGVIEECLKHIL